MVEADPDRRADIDRMITVVTESPGEGIVVLSVSGEVDLLTIESLEGRLRDALQHPNKRVVLDLSGVRFLGSAGLSTLIGGAESAHDNGIELLLVADERAILRPLEVTGIRSTFTVFDSVDAALATARS